MVSTSEPECGICHGARFVHPVIDGLVDYGQVVTCQCVKDEWEKHRKEFMISKCQLPPYTEHMTLKNFDVYSAVRTAYEEAKDMAGNPGKLAWLALIGENGNGKTHLAVSICKAWLKVGIPAKYALVSLLLEELRQGFNKEGDEGYEGKYQYYCNVPLLLLDDYGIESATKWVQEKLDTIIDYRMMNDLSLIITSNLSIDEMPARIRSRIMRHPQGKIVAIMAGDYSMRSRK